MNKKLQIMTDLGNKILFRTKCVACSVDYFEILNKQKNKDVVFLCEECENNKKH